MLKQILVLILMTVSFSGAFAQLRDTMNYGWVNRASSANFDPTSLASSLSYFKNKCTGEFKPCSPDSGVNTDGSLLCATGNSTGACYDESERVGGLNNLKLHLTEKCGSSCLAAEKDFYKYHYKKVEFCKGKDNFNCPRYSAFTETIKGFYTPNSIVLAATTGSASAAGSKLIQDLPKGDASSCDLVKGIGSRVGKNDSKYWSEVLGLATSLCGRPVDNITGYCSDAALPGELSPELKNIFNRMRSKQDYDADAFKKGMGFNEKQFKDIFCAKDTETFIKNSNMIAKTTLVTQSDVVLDNGKVVSRPYSGKSPWLQSCMTSGMVTRAPDKVTTSKYKGTTVTVTKEVYKTNGEANCSFIPVNDVVKALGSKNPSVMLMPKDPPPGAAQCMMAKNLKLTSDETNAARAKRGLSGVVPNSVTLQVPDGSQPTTYQFENVSDLGSKFSAFKWHCSTAADYEVQQTGGDASAAEQ
jgi:hypothetical protein